MNLITDIIFIIAWFTLLIFAIRQMSQGWNLINENPRRSNSVRDSGIYTRTVTKAVHPEMRDVEPGEELMGVTFYEETEPDPRFKLDSPELHNLDPLQKSLRDRINELNEEDEEDDDGDIVIGRR